MWQVPVDSLSKPPDLAAFSRGKQTERRPRVSPRSV
jgi:hypothetical protein